MADHDQVPGAPEGEAVIPPPSVDLSKVRDILQNASVVSGGSVAESATGPETAAKRGRGRPRKVAAEPAPADLPADDGDAMQADPDAAGPPGQDAGDIDHAAVERCAAFDQSDAGNADRLIAHFGTDLLVLRSEEAVSESYHVWTGRHWDRSGGLDAAQRMAQRIGPRIAIEARYLKHTPAEAQALRQARGIAARAQDTWSDEDRATLAVANKAAGALEGRRASRCRFGVTSRNAGRLTAMLKCAAPHLLRDADAFDADPLRLATLGHTLRFVRQTRSVLDPECPDPDVDRYVDQVVAEVVATPGHRREDLITKVVPIAYDPAAACPRWTAFVDEFLPVPGVRRCVQVFAGLGLTGIVLQRLLFHYGAGANGKSVFLETLVQLLGPLAVGLPPASLVGESRASGQQASPDLARLQGARCVRVAELPQGEPLKEALVKALTGGERMPVRNLFKGFIEFTPVFKAHLSGNGFPRIDGTDAGIWRRMTVVHWPVTLAEERRRELPEVVAGFMAEAPGILNWLIEGVLIYLREGFAVPEEVKRSTQEYRDEMDPIGQFAAECISEVEGQNVQARTMYRAYVAWSLANGKRALHETRFGRVMKSRFKTTKISVQVYVGVQLHDVPPMPDPEGGLEGGGHG